METLYLWHHTDPRTRRRNLTRYRLSERDALARLIEPVRVECSAMTATPCAPIPSGTFTSGLRVRESDGAKLPADAPPAACPELPSGAPKAAPRAPN